MTASEIGGRGIGSEDIGGDSFEIAKAAMTANRARLDQLIDLARGYHVALVAVLLALRKSEKLTQDDARKILEAALLALPLERQQSGTANVLMGAVDVLTVPADGDARDLTAVKRKLQALLDAMTGAIHE